MHRSSTRIVELASTINSTVAKLDEILRSRGHPTPLFEEVAPTLLPDSVLDMQNVIIDATSELHDLLLSPMAPLFQETPGLILIVSSKTSRTLSSHKPSRYCGYGSPRGPNFFPRNRHKEPEPAMVAHTSISKAITDPNIRNFLMMSTRDVLPASVKAFSLVHNTPLSLYEVFHAAPDRALRFARAMKALTVHPEYDIRHGIDNYAWSLGQAKVVDVGGNRGNVAIHLARRFPEPSILVQNKEEAIQGATDDVPADSKGRVTFAAHDILAPQTVEADVHLRGVKANNAAGILIFRALIPALKPNVRIVIQEACYARAWRSLVMEGKRNSVRAPCAPDFHYQYYSLVLCSMADLVTASLHNGRAWSIKDWRVLFSRADSRLVLKSASR
ncbi:hypothetical protein RRF57_008084 [Xylaria bambusicola]|uniref:O-methyltransferase domain-containing protein n=1 Tax=Xylaria bambusicola TaxID=326684 RepID=A0AAN7UH65_9PEZI